MRAVLRALTYSVLTYPARMVAFYSRDPESPAGCSLTIHRAKAANPRKRRRTA